MAKCRECNKGGLFSHMDSDGLCPTCSALKRAYAAEDQLRDREKDVATLRMQLENLNARITPEVLDAQLLERKLSALNAAMQEKQALLSDVEQRVQSRQADLDYLDHQFADKRELVELDSYALYTPRFSFATADGYKAALDDVREQEKDMISNKTAATCATTWDVNGNAAQGRRFVEDSAKMFLRAFNDECDSAVASVRFSNFDRCLDRIKRSFDSINRLGSVTQISISSQYLDLKIKELHLAHEYAVKKQAEKDEQAEIRREQRERLKLEKEIAEARKAAIKEKTHYEQALLAINAQILVCPDAERVSELEEKRQQIEDGLACIELKLEDIDYRQSNQRAGYVYIISNLGAFGENVYKIGMTRRLDPMERIRELSIASVPFNFDVHAMIFTADAPALEAALHRAFDDRRLNKVNLRREYFCVTLDEIKEVVRQNHDKTVEFKEEYTAEQYRQSLRMQVSAAEGTSADEARESAS